MGVVVSWMQEACCKTCKHCSDFTHLHSKSYPCKNGYCKGWYDEVRIYNNPYSIVPERYTYRVACIFCQGSKMAIDYKPCPHHTCAEHCPESKSNQ